MVEFYVSVLVVESLFLMGSSRPFINSGSATIDLVKTHQASVQSLKNCRFYENQ